MPWPLTGNEAQPHGRRRGMKQMRHQFFPALVVVLAALTIAVSSLVVWAASHREAPLIALDPAADNTDVYAFVSYDAANLLRSPDERKVTFIMNVNPGQDPGDGPNYFNFDDEVLYAINIDNDQDGRAEDIVYEVRFKTENRLGPGGLTSPVPSLGNPHIPAPGPAPALPARARRRPPRATPPPASTRPPAPRTHRHQPF